MIIETVVKIGAKLRLGATCCPAGARKFIVNRIYNLVPPERKLNLKLET